MKKTDTKIINNDSFTNDSSNINNRILKLIKYINELDNNCKGKWEGYHIGDEIQEIKKGLKIEFEKLNNTSHEKLDKERMKASIQEESGTFSTLIKTMKDKSFKVRDLTLSQYLSNQSKELTKWKNKTFKIRDTISKEDKIKKVIQVVNLVSDLENTVAGKIVISINKEFPTVKVLATTCDDEIILKFENLPQDINSWINNIYKLEEEYKKNIVDMTCKEIIIRK